MKKEEIIQKLNNGNFPNGVAEVICNVFNSQGKVQPNRSILVVVDKDGFETVDDLIINASHWFICNSIAEFEKNTIMVNQIGNYDFQPTLGKVAVGDFLDVRDFYTDLVPKDRNGKEIHVNDKVRWYSSDEQTCDLKRIYTISDVSDWNKDTRVRICDEYSEVEAFGFEIELVD